MFIAKKEHLKELILKRVSEYDIFRRYLGNFKLGGAIKSPFKKDSNPSLLIYTTGGHVYYKDMRGGEFAGDCFTLVMQLFGLSFPEALNKLARDFGIEEGGEWIVQKKDYVADMEKLIPKK